MAAARGPGDRNDDGRRGSAEYGAPAGVPATTRIGAGDHGGVSPDVIGLLRRIEELEATCRELAQTCEGFERERQGLVHERQDLELARLDAERRRLELERRCTDLERHVASQRRLLEVSEKLLMTLEPDAVLETLGGWLRSVVTYDSMSIHQADSGGLRPAIFAADAYSRVVHDPGIRPDEGLGNWVIGHGEAALVNDTQLDPRCATPGGEQMAPQAIIAAPLAAGDRVTGVIYVSRLGPQARFTEAEFDLVQLFAAQASLALRNARVHRAITDLAERDSLTGLRNHGAFQSDVVELIGRRGPFALVMLDLDEFKSFNDSHGHPAGDSLLRTIANAMAGATREADGVYRYGGDEFAVLLPGATRGVALEVAGRIRRAVSSVEVADVRVDVSAGVACFPDEAQTREELVAIADGMLYLAKRGIALHPAPH